MRREGRNAIALLCPITDLNPPKSACSRNSIAGPMMAKAPRWSATTSISLRKRCARMDLDTAQRVLDLGCGSGWATRLLARTVADATRGPGQVVGVDISDEMVRRARDESKDLGNATFVVGSAAQIPCEENSFDKVLSVESFYYYPDQDRALDELFRVMAPRGRLFILINLYKDNPYSLQWVPKLKVPVHIRSAAEYVELLKQHGFESAEHALIPDDTPTPDDYKTTSFRSLDDLRAFKRVGALLLMGSKPA